MGLFYHFCYMEERDLITKRKLSLTLSDLFNSKPLLFSVTWVALTLRFCFDLSFDLVLFLSQKTSFLWRHG